MTSVYFSGTKHEEDQPSHLLIADPGICQERCAQEFGNPCESFCPAKVYEILDYGAKKAKIVASDVLDRVRSSVGVSYTS